MIVKFHNRGTGAGKGPTEYLLGKDGQREGATLLRGDPEQTVELIDSLRFAKKYTSGVLSFAEADLSRARKNEIMDSFERALLPGLDADQYQCLWVEHRDKGRLELNFVVPNVELTSGKRLQPYYDKADRPRINAWKTAINGTLNLHDPDDPANQQALTLPSDLPRASQEAARAITEGLLGLVSRGAVASREDVLGVLKGHGFVVARETKSSISIENPEGGRNIRLKGALYERNFKFGPELRGEIEAASAAYRERSGARVRAALRDYHRGAEIKREENYRRYPRPAAEAEISRATDLDLADRHGRSGADRELGRALVDREQDRVEPGRDRAAEAAPSRAASANLGALFAKLGERPFHRAARGYQGFDRLDDGRPPRDQIGGGISDRTGETAVERVRAVTEQLRAAAQRVAGGLRELAGDVQAYLGGDSGLEAAGQRLERSGGELEQTAQTVIKQRSIAAQRYDRGPSF